MIVFKKIKLLNKIFKIEFLQCDGPIAEGAEGVCLPPSRVSPDCVCTCAQLSKLDMSTKLLSFQCDSIVFPTCDSI